MIWCSVFDEITVFLNFIIFSLLCKKYKDMVATAFSWFISHMKLEFVMSIA
jgi:hypothetical protein